MFAEKHKDAFVQTENLTVKMNSQLVLDGVDLTLPDQAISVLLGANGAGKSSLLRVLAGIYQVHDGRIFWPGSKGTSVLSPHRIAYVAEPAVFYPHLSVEEQLLFHAGSYKLLPMNAQQALEQWQLTAVAKKKTGHLSLGFRQRLALAQALMQRPRLLLLDEPMNGMDPELMTLFKSQVEKIKSHCCVVMASHLLHMMDDWVDYVVVMAQGAVLTEGEKVADKNLYQMYQESLALPVTKEAKV